MGAVGSVLVGIVGVAFLAGFVLLLLFVGLRSLARALTLIVLLLVGLRVRARVYGLQEDDGQDEITLYWPVVELHTIGGQVLHRVRMRTPLPAPPTRETIVVRYLPGRPRFATSPSLLMLARSVVQAAFGLGFGGLFIWVAWRAVRGQ